MTNLPGALREQLAASSSITRAEIVKESKAPDGTAKYLLKFGDGETVETVLLPYPTGSACACRVRSVARRGACSAQRRSAGL